MPFPAAILWGAAIMVGACGVKKMIDAGELKKQAAATGRAAEERYGAAQALLEEERRKTQRDLEDLGRLKLRVFTSQIRYVMKEIRRRLESSRTVRSELSGYGTRISVEELKKVEVLVEKSLEAEKGLAGGAASGVLMAMGACGSVGAFATASTGTAIASLSGAAATNATLAWLGGGSLAAGGFGMTGGMVALGGIALAPILFIGGFFMAARAEEALTEAQSYAAKVDVAVAEMEKVKVSLGAIREAAAEQTAVIREMVRRFERVRVSALADEDDFDRMCLFSRNLRKILEVPVLLEDGSVNGNLRVECSGYMKLEYNGILESRGAAGAVARGVGSGFLTASRALGRGIVLAARGLRDLARRRGRP